MFFRNSVPKKKQFSWNFTFATTSLAGLVYSQDVVLVYSPRPTNLVLTLNFYLWGDVAEKKSLLCVGRTLRGKIIASVHQIYIIFTNQEFQLQPLILRLPQRSAYTHNQEEKHCGESSLCGENKLTLRRTKDGIEPVFFF